MFSEWALLSLPSPWNTQLIYDKICDNSVALFYASFSWLVSGIIKTFTVTRSAVVLCCAPAQCHSHQCIALAYELSLGLQHLKSVFNLLYRSSLHSSFICETCPWSLPEQFSPAQSSVWSFSYLPLDMDRCRRCIFSRFLAGTMSHSHPYAVTHPIPTTLSHTRCCCCFDGAVMEKWKLGFFERSF